MADSTTLLEPNHSYHIFNHAVGNENLFNSDRNFHFFLNKLERYLADFIEIYCYCLMPNHFHLLITVKNGTSVHEAFHKYHPNKMVKGQMQTSKIISSQFSHLFNSYAQAYNKENKRKGSLFYNRFKRKLVNSEEYFTKLIQYIHFNPVHHGMANNINEWKHSSYNLFFSREESFIKRDRVIELFGDIENFKLCHKLQPDIFDIDDI